jgi:hypothetical protein
LGSPKIWLKLALILSCHISHRQPHFLQHGSPNEEVRDEVCDEVNEKGGEANINEEDRDEEEGS